MLLRADWELSFRGEGFSSWGHKSSLGFKDLLFGLVGLGVLGPRVLARVFVCVWSC